MHFEMACRTSKTPASVSSTFLFGDDGIGFEIDEGELLEELRLEEARAAKTTPVEKRVVKAAKKTRKQRVVEPAEEMPAKSENIFFASNNDRRNQVMHELLRPLDPLRVSENALKTFRMETPACSSYEGLGF